MRKLLAVFVLAAVFSASAGASRTGDPAVLKLSKHPIANMPRPGWYTVKVNLSNVSRQPVKMLMVFGSSMKGRNNQPYPLQFPGFSGLRRQGTYYIASLRMAAGSSRAFKVVFRDPHTEHFCVVAKLFIQPRERLPQFSCTFPT